MHSKLTFYCFEVGFGVVPFTYSIQDSMAEPNHLMRATIVSLSTVFLAYAIMGDIIAIIFVQGIQSDIISELPTNSALPTFVRLLMTVTICKLTLNVSDVEIEIPKWTCDLMYNLNSIIFHYPYYSLFNISDHDPIDNHSSG